MKKEGKERIVNISHCSHYMRKESVAQSERAARLEILTSERAVMDLEKVYLMEKQRREEKMTPQEEEQVLRGNSWKHTRKIIGKIAKNPFFSFFIPKKRVLPENKSKRKTLFHRYRNNFSKHSRF